jgi:hypothetical protein
MLSIRVVVTSCACWDCAGPADAPQSVKSPSPGRESPVLGPLKSTSVMSSVLSGVRRGMETISSEAANVIHRVTNTGKLDGEPEENSMSGQLRYSPPPTLSSTSSGPGPQVSTSALWGSQDTGVSFMRFVLSAGPSSLLQCLFATDLP